MARHSHWHSIRLKKGAEDRKRGKIFTKHARLIETAVRKNGADPKMNASLRLAIENARGDNVPLENIERAVKKGAGEGKGALDFQEVTYEGYGPGGVALLIDCLTDNKNRTNQVVRTVLQNHGGNIGSQGATSFLFEPKGFLEVKMKSERDSDELEIIDAGAEDLENLGDNFAVYTEPSDLGKVKKILEEKKFDVMSTKLLKEAKNLVSVDEVSKTKIIALLEALEDEDDVVGVYTNADL